MATPILVLHNEIFMLAHKLNMIAHQVFVVIIELLQKSSTIRHPQRKGPIIRQTGQQDGEVIQLDRNSVLLIVLIKSRKFPTKFTSPCVYNRYEIYKSAYPRCMV